MKLILCKECQDVIKLQLTKRSCMCGKSYGYYKKDEFNAVISGPCIPIGINNNSLITGIFLLGMIDKIKIDENKVSYEDLEINAFFIREPCTTITRE